MLKFKTLLAVVLFTTLCMANSNQPLPKDGARIYIIKEGDTLSDISQRFYGNSFYWPRLWESNPHIDDPHSIRPGDRISLFQGTPPRIPSAARNYSLRNLPVIKLDPNTREKPFEYIVPPNPVYYYSQGKSQGFITKERWRHFGAIISSEPLKILLGKGDHIYANLGTDHGVRPGDKFSIFRGSAQVFHPVTGEEVGYKVANLGEIEILSVLGKDQSFGIITNSYREITKNAKLRPLEQPLVSEVVVRKGKRQIEGVILESKNDLALNSVGNVVYIDIGKDDNVFSGHTFSIFQYPRKTHDTDKNAIVTIPGVKIGQLVVLDVQKSTATGLIIKNSRQIELGDIVVSDI